MDGIVRKHGRSTDWDAIARFLRIALVQRLTAKDRVKITLSGQKYFGIQNRKQRNTLTESILFYRTDHCGLHQSARRWQDDHILVSLKLTFISQYNLRHHRNDSASANRNNDVRVYASDLTGSFVSRTRQSLQFSV